MLEAANQIEPKTTRVLVIGSLSSAQDGSYQSRISELASQGQNVEKQLLDRITDNGGYMFLPYDFHASMKVLNTI